jgi:hypothetical protein
VYRFPAGPWAADTARGTARPAACPCRHDTHPVQCMGRHPGPWASTGTARLKAVARPRHGGNLAQPAHCRGHIKVERRVALAPTPNPKSFPPGRSRVALSSLSRLRLPPVSRSAAAVRLELAGPAPVASTPRRPLLLPLLPPFRPSLLLLLISLRWNIRTCESSSCFSSRRHSPSV